MKRSIGLILLFASIFFSGCSINHRIADDYEQYLLENQGSVTLPNTELEANYVVERNTQTHKYEFRAFSVGTANLWIVEFGKILDKTLQSSDVQESFGKLTKILETDTNEGNLVTFKLIDYYFIDYCANVTLDISIMNGDGIVVLDQTYQADGKRQQAKMWIGGVFLMKNAIRQSTKYATDSIISDFINDINLQSLHNNKPRIFADIRKFTGPQRKELGSPNTHEEREKEEQKRSNEIISKYFQKTSLPDQELPDLNELALILKNDIDLNNTSNVLYYLSLVSGKVRDIPKEKVDNHMKKLFDMFIENGLQITEDCNKNLYNPITDGMTQYLIALMNNGCELCREINIGTTVDHNMIDPIILAEKYGHDDLIDVFVECGSKRNSPRERAQLRLVGGAETLNRKQILEALRNGAYINSPDIFREYALIELLETSDLNKTKGLETLKLLIMMGAKPDFSFNGEFALNVAVENPIYSYPISNLDEYDTLEIIKILLDAGALVSTKSGYLDRTPLHIAAEKGYYGIARILVENGAKVMILDKIGKTPLDLARSGKIIKLLKENGAVERGY